MEIEVKFQHFCLKRPTCNIAYIWRFAPALAQLLNLILKGWLVFFRPGGHPDKIENSKHTEPKPAFYFRQSFLNQIPYFRFVKIIGSLKSEQDSGLPHVPTAVLFYLKRFGAKFPKMVFGFVLILHQIYL